MNAFIDEVKAGHAELMSALGISSFEEMKTKFLEHNVYALTKDVKEFFAAIDFKEPLFMWLLGFHLVIFALACYSTRGKVSDERLLLVCLLLAGLALGAPYINTYGRDRASSIFYEEERMIGMEVNYFDEAGIFIAVFYWLPLVLQVLGLMGRLLWRMLKLMVKVKRQQLKRESVEASKKRQ